VVVAPDVADPVAKRPRRAPRAAPVLRRGCVVVVLGVLRWTGLVVVELRVLDRQVPTGVRAGEAERAVLRVGVVQERVAVGTGADVVARVAHVGGVAVDDAPGPVGVADEDAVVPELRVNAVRVGRGRGDVVAPPGADPDLAGTIAAVPPDLVPLA